MNRFSRFSIPHSCGFTLQEMLIAIGIGGSLMLSLPSLFALVQESRAVSWANHFMGHLSFARSEAVKRGVPVVLCKSADGINCTSTGEWHEGWIVFVDQNASDSREAAEHLLLVEQALPAGLHLRFGALAAGFVSYKPNGFAWPNGTFTLCDSRGASKAKAVILHRTGRPYVSRKKSNGDPLTCPATA